MSEDTINIDGKVIGVIVILFLLIASIFSAFFMDKSSKSNVNNLDFKAVQTDTNSEEIPEKCRLPAGQDLDSWKEHLGHHAETKECLQYFK